MSRWRAIALFLATLALVAVYVRPAPPFGSTHQTKFAAIDGEQAGSLDIEALPVTLVDLTGMVTAIAPNDWAVRFDDAGTDVLQLAGAPASIRIYWLGGACSAEARIGLASDGADGYVVSIDEQATLGGLIGCAGLGVPRRLTIEFDRPVAPLAFRVSYRPG